MSEMIKKASAEEIINHWVLAISCFLLIVTGYAFLFHLEGVGAAFGGFNGMRVVHNWAGIVFALSLLATTVNYLGEALSFDADDWRWLKAGGGYFSGAKLPPMGKLNTAQKIYYLVILIAGAGISASGLLIWLVPGNRPLTLACHLVHNLSFILFVVAVPGHIYLGTLANPGTFRIMVYGTVPLEFAKKKYPKWMKEIGKM